MIIMKKSKVFMTLVLAVIIAIESCGCMVDNSTKKHIMAY